MGEGGRLLAPGEVGEIVIRGPNVTRGYENNDDANWEAFIEGWFRTGDQGTLDPDGYLTITGRLKEIINRGGEKIAPREVDEVLLDHPAVAEAVTFAVPHAHFGEEVAAAVVLRPGRHATEAEIRGFVEARLAYFKTPSRLLILDEIPKGPTGKPQRIGLARTLGLAGEAPARTSTRDGPTAPRTVLEASLAQIWREILRIESVGVNDGFLELGGDSMAATRVVARILRPSGRRSVFGNTVCRAHDRRDGRGRRARPGRNGREFDRLLAEVEGLSDEEAARLISGGGEQTASP